MKRFLLRLARPLPIAALIAIGVAIAADIDRAYELSKLAAIIAWPLVLLSLIDDRRRLPRVTPDFRDEVLALLAAAARRGEPMGAALAALAEEVKGRRRLAVQGALRALEDGAPLSVALSRADAPFLTREEATALAAVEGTGSLATLFGSTKFRRRERTMVQFTVFFPVVYGLLIFTVAAFTGSNILSQFLVIAKATDGVHGLDVAVPGALTFLVETDALLLAFEVIAGAALIAVFYQWSRRRPRLQGLLRSGLLRLPAIGYALRLQATARVTRVLGLLLAAGEPLHRALSRAAPAAAIPAMTHRLEEAAAAVSHGDAPREALAASGLPAFAVARIAAASAAGGISDLGRALEALADECTQRASNRRAFLRGLVYPCVVATAGTLGYLTYVAVYETIGNIQEALRTWH